MSANNRLETSVYLCNLKNISGLLLLVSLLLMNSIFCEINVAHNLIPLFGIVCIYLKTFTKLKKHNAYGTTSIVAITIYYKMFTVKACVKNRFPPLKQQVFEKIKSRET